MDFLQTTLCYLEKDGCVSDAAPRTKEKRRSNHDKWVGVGGKFEPGEDALACALREVTRGDRPDDARPGLPRHRGFLSVTPWPAERMHLYTCTQFAGAMTDCERGRAWSGCPRPAVQDLPDLAGRADISSTCWRRTHRFSIWSCTYDGDALAKGGAGWGKIGITVNL